MHGNNVFWLCAKYAVDANLFRLESSILTRAQRATNRNNVATEKRGGIMGTIQGAVNPPHYGVERFKGTKLGRRGVIGD